jgi:hypothetical protein
MRYLLLALLFIHSSVVEAASPPPSLRTKLSAQLQAQIAEVERDYKLVIYVDSWKFPKQRPGTYRIQGLQAKLKDLEHFLPIFLEEWRLLPTMLVHRTRLKYIAFGRQFRLPAERMEREAIPDYHHEGMYYSVAYDHQQPILEHYFRGVVHHEYFHYVDFRDDGIVYGDDVWKKLNSAGFKYGRGGASARGNTQGLVRMPKPGFITDYASSGVEEDKAEVFRCMLVNLVEMEARAKSDEYLARKVQQMKKLLNDFCPELDEPYWASLRLMAAQRPRLTSPGYEDAWAKAHPVLEIPQAVAELPLCCECQRGRRLFGWLRCR